MPTFALDAFTHRELGSVRSTVTVTHATPTMIDWRRLLALAAGAPVLALGRTTAAQAPPAGMFSIAPGQEFAANSYVHQKLPADAPIDRHSASYVRRFLLAAILALLSLRAYAFIQDGEFANTFVNTPLAPNAPLDPNSAAIVAEVVLNTPSGWVVDVVSGVPIYFVDETVPTVQIRGPESVYKVPVEWQLSAVPLPGSFEPAEGSDKTAIIYRPSTNELWELWAAQPTEQTTVDSAGNIVPEWSAAWGGHMTNVSGNPGYFLEDPNFPGLKWGYSATSVAGLGLVITIEEQRVGVINHALGFATTTTSSDGFVFPAQRGDGWSPGALVKEGMIFRFPASLNLDALGLTPYGLMIAKAIQKYGMVVTDTAGWGFSAISAEGQGANYYPGWTDVYSDVGGILGCRDLPPPEVDYQCWPDAGPGHLLDGIPWNQLQVIQPPAR